MFRQRDTNVSTIMSRGPDLKQNELNGLPYCLLNIRGELCVWAEGLPFNPEDCETGVERIHCQCKLDRSANTEGMG